MNYRRAVPASIAILVMIVCSISVIDSSESDADTYVATVDGTGYTTIQSAIDDADSGDIVYINDDVDLRSGGLTVTKSMVIDGQHHTIESTSRCVLNIYGSNLDVTVKDLMIKATNSSMLGRCIGLGGMSSGASPMENCDITIVGSTLETTQRGITVYTDGNTNLNITVRNSSISLTNGITDYDKEVHPTNNFDFSRGISLWQMNDSHVVIDGTTIQGFYYPINYAGRLDERTTIDVTDSVLKGRCAFNFHSSHITVNMSDTSCIGINNWEGELEGFSFLVNDTGTRYNTFHIDDCSFFVYMNSTGSTNDNATEYLMRAQDSSSVVIVDMDSDGTGTVYHNEYLNSGDSPKGGILECGEGTVQLYGGSFMNCDDLTYDSDYLAPGTTMTVDEDGVKHVSKTSSSSGTIKTSESSLVTNVGTSTTVTVSMPSASVSIRGYDGLNTISVSAVPQVYAEAPKAIASYEITIVSSVSYVADITVKASIPYGHSAQVYYIDPDGDLVPVTVVKYTSSTVTFRTDHTTPFVVMSTPIPIIPDYEGGSDYPFPPGGSVQQTDDGSDDVRKLTIAVAAVIVILLASVALLTTRNR